jgi:hypothetical protein
VATNILDLGLRVRRRDTVYSKWSTEQFMKGNGKTINKMVKGVKNGLMDLNTEDNLRMVKRMGMES